MKKKLTVALSFIVIELCVTVLQIYNIATSFVNGEIAMGVIFSIILVAFLIWNISYFFDDETDDNKGDD